MSPRRRLDVGTSMVHRDRSRTTELHNETFVDDALHTGHHDGAFGLMKHQDGVWLQIPHQDGAEWARRSRMGTSVSSAKASEWSCTACNPIPGHPEYWPIVCGICAPCHHPPTTSPTRLLTPSPLRHTHTHTRARAASHWPLACVPIQD